MRAVWSALLVVGVSALAAGVLLLVRRRAPAGGSFADGDRAAGVFGVLATGFSVLLGLIVFLAYSSYDTARAGAEDEARLVVQQYETAQFFQQPTRTQLGGELVCYARSVVHREWPRLDNGIAVEGFNPWGVALFHSLKAADPRGFAATTAYDKWLDRTADREQARSNRLHAAAGVIPVSLWVVLFFIAAVIFAFMLLFADSTERWTSQAAMMASVIAVISATMLLIHSLGNPFQPGLGGLKPVAMERSLRTLDQERAFVGDRSRPPCNAAGFSSPAA